MGSEQPVNGETSAEPESRFPALRSKRLAGRVFVRDDPELSLPLRRDRIENLANPLVHLPVHGVAPALCRDRCKPNRVPVITQFGSEAELQRVEQPCAEIGRNAMIPRFSADEVVDARHVQSLQQMLRDRNRSR
jgi:hypothetical protein